MPSWSGRSGTHRNTPNGTDLWAEYNPPNKFEIWYSPLNWYEVLEDTGKHDWEYVGAGFWESECRGSLGWRESTVP